MQQQGFRLVVLSAVSLGCVVLCMYVCVRATVYATSQGLVLAHMGDLSQKQRVALIWRSECASDLVLECTQPSPPPPCF